MPSPAPGSVAANQKGLLNISTINQLWPWLLVGGAVCIVATAWFGRVLLTAIRELGEDDK